MATEDLQFVEADDRNKSVDVHKDTPDLPNRSTPARARAIKWPVTPITGPNVRLRAIRWLSPLEAPDLPDFYPMPSAGRIKLPPIASLPTRAIIAITDKAWDRITSFGEYVGIYKPPNVILGLVSDRVWNDIRGLSYGDYFALWITTSLNEKALATFELVTSTFTPLLHLSDSAHQLEDVGASEHFLKYPKVEAAEKAALAATLGHGDTPPIIYIQESAAEMMSTGPGNHLMHWQTAQILERAVENLLTGVGELHSTGIEILEKVTGGFTTGVGGYTLSLCSVVLTNGGGNTFDCYVDGYYSNGLTPLTGTGLDALYGGDSQFGYDYGDTFEDYADASYDGGTPGASVTGYTTIYVQNIPFVTDDFESYTLAAELDGLNAGNGWNAAYVSRDYLSSLDDFETYTDTADLNGLNSGSNWNAAYTSR